MVFFAEFLIEVTTFIQGLKMILISLFSIALYPNFEARLNDKTAL